MFDFKITEGTQGRNMLVIMNEQGPGANPYNGSNVEMIPLTDDELVGLRKKIQVWERQRGKTARLGTK